MVLWYTETAQVKGAHADQIKARSPHDRVKRFCTASDFRTKRRRVKMEVDDRHQLLPFSVSNVLH